MTGLFFLLLAITLGLGIYAIIEKAYAPEGHEIQRLEDQDFLLDDA